MDIYSKPGSKVVFIGGHDKTSINWGSHDDPSELLTIGSEYTVARTEVHSYHTKVFLEGLEGKSFNSVWFENKED